MLGSAMKRVMRRAALAVPRVSRPVLARPALKASTLLASKPSRLAVAAMPKRVMSTDAAVKADSKDDALVEEPKGGLLNRGYDVYPVVGLGLAAAITQEYWIFDEFWITGGCFVGVMYAAYVLGYERVVAGGKAAFEKRTQQTKSAFGIRLDMLKRYKLLEEFSLSHADELRNLYAEEAKINQMAVDYQNLKHKHDTRHAVLSKLNAIKVLEEDARTQAIGALSKKAGEYVTQAYAAAPQAVKNKNIDAGIAAIAPELTTRSVALSRNAPPAPLAADDPVKLLFDEFLATPRTFEQLGVENYVVKFMERAKEKKH